MGTARGLMIHLLSLEDNEELGSLAEQKTTFHMLKNHPLLSR